MIFKVSFIIFRTVNNFCIIPWSPIIKYDLHDRESDTIFQKSGLMISDKRKPIVQVLHSSVILIRLLVCSFCWLTNTFVYYGLSLNSVAFAGDKYINFVLVAVVEIPAYCLAWVLSDYIGRKPTLSGAFLLSGAFCLAIQFVPAGKEIKKKTKKRFLRQGWILVSWVVYEKPLNRVYARGIFAKRERISGYFLKH